MIETDKTTSTQRQLFTVCAALEYLEGQGLTISERTLYRRIAHGDVDVIRPFGDTGTIRIRRDTLDDMLHPR